MISGANNVVHKIYKEYRIKLNTIFFKVKSRNTKACTRKYNLQFCPFTKWPKNKIEYSFLCGSWKQMFSQKRSVLTFRNLANLDGIVWNSKRSFPFHHHIFPFFFSFLFQYASKEIMIKCQVTSSNKCCLNEYVYFLLFYKHLELFIFFPFHVRWLEVSCRLLYIMPVPKNKFNKTLKICRKR